MKYEDLYDDFVNLFPEDKQLFNDLSVESAAHQEDGMHIMFGMVVVPYLKRIIINDSEKTRVAFDYIEKMEKSGDSKIAEVVEFTILESILDSENKNELLRECEKYMGEETRLALNNISGWFK